MSAVPSPFGSSRPPVAGFTSKVNPAGVSAANVSGELSSVGSKLKRSQPVKPTGFSFASCERKLASAVTLGSCQVFAQIENDCGPVHEVASVRNGCPTLPGGVHSDPPEPQPPEPSVRHG